MKKEKTFLTYALNDNGDLVHVDDVPNGNKCKCYCPHCKSELCAKNGGVDGKRVHHFAHLNGADCVGAVESALHKMAKDIMKEVLCVHLPLKHGEQQSKKIKFDSVDVEVYDSETQLRPDCIGYYGEKFLWIEFKRTHAVGKKKKGKIISSRIDCIELDLNKCELNPKAIREFIVNSSESRIWIRDTEENNGEKSYERYGMPYDSRTYRRMFAKDENNNLVNILEDNYDMNTHSYYCIACSKELSIDVDEFGNYGFVHLDEDSQCFDTLYLRETAKEIIFNKFLNSSDFKIYVPQNCECEDYSSCVFYNSNKCTSTVSVAHDLKKLGYTECVKDYKFPNSKYKYDILIKRHNSLENAIIINIKSLDCHIKVDANGFRMIDIKLYNENNLLSLLKNPLNGFELDYTNFKSESNKKSSRFNMERECFKFSLYNSGKYFFCYTLCHSLYESKRSTVVEHLYINDIDDRNAQDARWFSLLRCYNQGRKSCYCELCCYLVKNNYNFADTDAICKRYKTKGTPRNPLKTLPIKCPYFRLDKEIESMIELNCSNMKIKEIVHSNV